MKLFIVGATGKRISGTVPERGVAFALFEGACPACGVEPFNARGENRRIATDDRAYEADAFAVCCEVGVGRMRLETDTLFGIREDIAIGARARVYRGS